MRDMYFFRDLHLGLSFKIPQIDDVFFALRKAFDGVAKRDRGEPSLVGISLVCDRILNIERISSVLVDRLRQADREPQALCSFVNQLDTA